MCSLRRNGSKTNGLPLPPTEPLAFWALWLCVASKSVSSAIFFRKATDCQSQLQKFLDGSWGPHSFCKPTIAVALEPTEMTAERSGAQNGVWVLLEFPERDGLLNRDLFHQLAFDRLMG